MNAEKLALIDELEARLHDLMERDKLAPADERLSIRQMIDELSAEIARAYYAALHS